MSVATCYVCDVCGKAHPIEVSTATEYGNDSAWVPPGWHSLGPHPFIHLCSVGCLIGHAERLMPVLEEAGL